MKWNSRVSRTLSFAVLAQSIGTLSASDENAIPFSPGFDIKTVAQLATSLPSHSWEFGTASEALLELYDAPYSVYGARPFPVPSLTLEDSPSLVYAKQKINISTPPDGLSNGDGAVGDPASLGVSAVLLGQTDPLFAQAAKAEAEYVVGQAPRWQNGAISHRAQYAELWADFIYMAPPFLAYYGVSSKNVTFLWEGVQQCLLYRDVLLANVTSASDPTPPIPPNTHPLEASGLWVHIVGPVNADPGIWSTGNAWAAAGTMRVLATLVKAPSSLFSSHPAASNSDIVNGGLTIAWKQNSITSLTSIISDILDAAMRVQPDPTNDLLRNYLDDPTWFGEISGSALLASVAYRLSTLAASTRLSLLTQRSIRRYIAWAEEIRCTFGNEQQVTSNGTAIPAVNPLGWGDRNPYTAGSPEGQNFVVLMYAAWRDCVRAEVCARP